METVAQETKTEKKIYSIQTINQAPVMVSNRRLNIHLHVKPGIPQYKALDPEQVSFLKIEHRTNLRVTPSDRPEESVKEALKTKSRTISKVKAAEAKVKEESSSEASKKLEELKNSGEGEKTPPASPPAAENTQETPPAPPATPPAAPEANQQPPATPPAPPSDEKSTQIDYRDAIKKINESDNAEWIRAYVEGEERVTVSQAAETRLSEIAAVTMPPAPDNQNQE